MISSDNQIDFEDILAVFRGLHVLGKGSWKNREVGKFQVENLCLSWKVSSKVGKFFSEIEKFV